MPDNRPNRRFTFTLHNWTDTDWDYVRSLDKSNECIEHLKVAKETGSAHETPHFQGCVVFNSRFKKQRPSAISKILMGPNKDIARPDPNDPSKTLKHHYHCDGMRGTTAEAAGYCGDPSKEEGCDVHESGPLPISRQGHRTDHEDAQKIIIEKAQEGMKFKDLKLLLPKCADQSLKWMRELYLEHRTVRENFFATHTPHKWQSRLAEFLDRDPDPRAILFIVDFIGNSGKSEFVKNAHYLCPDKDVWCCKPKDTTSLSNLVPDDGAMSSSSTVPAPQPLNFRVIS